MDTVVDLLSRRFSHVGYTLILPGSGDGMIRQSMRDTISLPNGPENRKRLPKRRPARAIHHTIDRRWQVSLIRPMPPDRTGHPRWAGSSQSRPAGGIRRATGRARAQRPGTALPTSTGFGASVADSGAL